MPTRIGRSRLKPRKAPRQPRSADTVAAIVEAAARILETRGLDGFNTNAVAERAGVSVGSLYQYFPGKEALIAALSARERGHLAADVAAAARPAAGQTLEAALRHLARVAIARQLERPALARVLDFEEQRLVLDEGDRATTGSMASEIARLLSRHRDDIEVDDLEEAAFDIIAIARGLIDGAASRGSVERGPVERGPVKRRPLEDRVTRAVLGYLGSRARFGR